MGKRSREKRERLARKSFGEGEKEGKFEPQTGLEKTCLFIIHWLTYLALFTPLIVSAKFFFPFVGPKSLYFMGLAEIIFFSWLILIINSPQYRLRKNVLVVALVLFLIVLTLSSFFGENLSYSFWSKPERMTGLLMWFHLFAFFLVVSSVFRKKDDWIKVFSVSIFVGVILSLITFFSENPSMRGGATIGNSSFLGTYLLFNIFLALWLILNSPRGLKIYSAIGLAIMISALLLSGARAAGLSVLVGLVLLFLLYLAFAPPPKFWWGAKRYLNILGRVSLVGILIVFLISTFYLFQPDNIIHNWFVERATKARLVVWEKAWKGFLEKPLFGWGPENFDFVFTKYFNPCMFLQECGGEIWFDRAHNIIFDTLVATGILGFLAYLGIFLSTFYLLWKNYFKNRVEFWTVGIFTVLLISYSIQNLTVFDMVSSYLMFFLVLGFVASIAVPRETPSLPKIISIKLWSLSIILILFIFSFFYFIIQPLKTDYYVIVALRSLAASEERLNFYKKTLEASPLGKYQIRDFFGQATLESAQSEKVREVSAENFKKEIDFVIEELEKSTKESPLDFRSHLKLGQLYNVYAVLLDQTKIFEAERVLIETVDLSPTNQQGYWSLAQTWLYQGRLEEAFSLAEKALALEPKLLESHRIVIQIAKIMGDYELAEEKIEEAIKINPEWEEDLTKIF